LNKEDVMSRRFLVAATLLSAACTRGPAIDTQQVTAQPIRGTLPTEDPRSSMWNSAPEHPAALMVQDVTEPRLTTPGVGLMKVRALHDGKWILFRLEWDDATQDLVPVTGKSSDAVAIQLPVERGANVPNPAMGEQQRPVQIAYWRAAWQADRDRAAKGAGDRVASLYPGATTDHYPYDVNPAAREEMERRYAPARAADNPISTPPNGGAVQEMFAQGFGASAASPAQHAKGRGLWQRNKWTTTIARPLDEGSGAANLRIGEKTYIAFAVWDGAARHTGSRKMRSGWIPLVVGGN
jgi:hypothetical protein